jgi:glycosyltransferase involved in cell wall biosynthesis
MNDFVSIVVSAYNRKDLLLRSLRSIEQNTDYPYELIVHDDGSSDGTTEMLYELCRAKRICTVIQNPEGCNRGHGTAVNRAVAISEGKYIVKLNGDDLVYPCWLSKAVKVMETYPEIGLLHLAAYDYSWVHNSRFPDDPWKYGEDHTTIHREFRDGIHLRVVWCGPGDGLMFTRDTWNRSGPWPHSYDPAFGEDVYFRLMCCPMMRRPDQPATSACGTLSDDKLEQHWAQYKDTPWLAMMDPTVVDFSMGDGKTLVGQAQKTLMRGPLLLGA